jgi:hypothetical protein
MRRRQSARRLQAAPTRACDPSVRSLFLAAYRPAEGILSSRAEPRASLGFLRAAKARGAVEGHLFSPYIARPKQYCHPERSPARLWGFFAQRRRVAQSRDLSSTSIASHTLFSALNDPTKCLKTAFWCNPLAAVAAPIFAISAPSFLVITHHCPSSSSRNVNKAHGARVMSVHKE